MIRYRAIGSYIELVRVKHWIKNLFVFAPLVFSLNLFSVEHFTKCLIAFFSFCCVSSAVYIINDLFDRERDRRHPHKKKRPIARGDISTAAAITISLFMLLLSIIFSVSLNLLVLLVIIGYLSMNLIYSAVLKHKVLFDVMMIATGFVLRIIAGTYAIDVHLSNWIVLTTFFISLFLGFCKRRQEIVCNKQHSDQIPVLGYYSVKLLDFLILVSLTLTIMTYSLYIIRASTLDRFGTNKLIFTIPLVVYGLFRYLYVIFTKQENGDPAEIVLREKSILIDILLWIALVIAVLYLRL